MLTVQQTTQLPQSQQQQTLMSPTSSATLPKYSLVEPTNHHTNPLVVYLSNSIRRDVGLLAAMGVIKESGVKVINSYLPFITSNTAISSSDEEAAVIRALSDSNCTLPLSSSSGSDSEGDAHMRSSVFAQSAGNLPKASDEPSRPIMQVKKLNRQRSETAPMRPAAQSQLPQLHPLAQQQQTAQQPLSSQAQFQRGPSSPRKEKMHGHSGLGAKLGAFFNKLTLDSETSPRPKAGGAKGGATSTPTASPRTPVLASPYHYQHPGPQPEPGSTKSPSLMSFQLSTAPLDSEAETGASFEARRVHERSFSDAPKAPQLARIGAVVQSEPRMMAHRVTVSHCQQAAPLERENKTDNQRKPSHGSHVSGASSGASTTTGGYASADSTPSASASNRSVDRVSGASASTLATRKRSFTHLGLGLDVGLGLSMEALSPEQAGSLQPTARGPQLRRTKPAANIAALQAKLVSPSGGISEGMARLAAPTNSLGLVLQTSTAAMASKAKSKPRQMQLPTPAPIRTQRHHNSFSVMARDPKSPTQTGRMQGGLAAITGSRHPASPTGSKSAAPSTLAFPPMPSDACQAAMLSGSTSSLQLSLVAEQAEMQRRTQQQVVPPPIGKALSDSTMDKSIAAMVVVATAAYDYTSSIKGDLEFT
ncbi:hypothetical protein GGI05_005194, partial [Coemansia sp. RSA 2603]